MPLGGDAGFRKDCYERRRGRGIFKKMSDLMRKHSVGWARNG